MDRMKMSDEELNNLALDSQAVYYGPDRPSQSINAPIFMSSNFEYDKEIYQRVIDGERKEVNIYSRCGNPTEYKLEEQIKLLHKADECLVTSSGMAAISTFLFAFLKSGDHIVADWTTYSSTHEMLDHRWTDFGIETTFVDTSDLKQVEEAIKPNTKLLYLEAIANPTMKVSPIKKLVELAHSKDIPVLCDNTFASPYVLRPIELGVDIVIESASKWIGGHGDVIGGAIAIKFGLIKEDFMYYMRWNSLTKLGGNISPFNAWLLLRGIQTLAVRMEKSCESAKILAAHLEKHPDVQKVWYPGSESHPQHDIVKEQMPMGGAMLAFEIGDEARAVRVLDSTKLVSFAGSLGGVRTTCQVPSTMAFLDVPADQKEKMNIRDGLIRISVGLENVDDLIKDFDKALEATKN
ncbi:MAG: aminotransferase class I/II-fold pyridoxal phosphate-dependent enzyme [Desulfovibrionales bacterium]|nr:aminotransferase class I/II-fold pyridoxal phosphate-dependent enzyme [Desulfovibrionales bacterium]